MKVRAAPFRVWPIHIEQGWAGPLHCSRMEQLCRAGQPNPCGSAPVWQQVGQGQRAWVATPSQRATDSLLPAAGGGRLVTAAAAAATHHTALPASPCCSSPRSQSTPAPCARASPATPGSSGVSGRAPGRHCHRPASEPPPRSHALTAASSLSPSRPPAAGWILLAFAALYAVLAGYTTGMLFAAKGIRQDNYR